MQIIPDAMLNVLTPTREAEFDVACKTDGGMRTIFGLFHKQGIRQEEMWHILWNAGLITDDDFYRNGPCFETLTRASAKADSIKSGVAPA